LQLKVYEGLEASMNRWFLSHKSSQGPKLQFSHGRALQIFDRISTERSKFFMKEIMCVVKILILPLIFFKMEIYKPKFSIFWGKHFLTRRFSDSCSTTENLLWATAPPPFASLPRRY